MYPSDQQTYLFYVMDTKWFSTPHHHQNWKISWCNYQAFILNTFYILFAWKTKSSSYDDLLHQLDFPRSRNERKWYFYICKIFPPLWKWITYFLQTWLVAKFDMKVDINTFQWEICVSFWDVFLIPKVW